MAEREPRGRGCRGRLWEGSSIGGTPDIRPGDLAFLESERNPRDSERKLGPQSHLSGGHWAGRAASPRGEGRLLLTWSCPFFAALEKARGASLPLPRPSSRPSWPPFSPRPATTPRRPGAATSTSSCATRTAPAPSTPSTSSPRCSRYGRRACAEPASWPSFRV